MHGSSWHHGLELTNTIEDAHEDTVTIKVALGKQRIGTPRCSQPCSVAVLRDQRLAQAQISRSSIIGELLESQ